MPIKLNTASGGGVILTGANTASDKTITVPAVDGTMQIIKLETSKASTSGTSIDFTDIPSWVKRITVMLSGVSTNGTSNLLIRIGDSGGISATGYQGAASAILSGAASGPTGSSVGYLLGGANAGNQCISNVVITNVTGNTWIASGVLYFSDAQINQFAGAKTLTGTLDRVRITTVNGTDTFDAGTINLLLEG